MALLFVDTFDHYGTADLAQKYSTITPPSGPNSPVQAIAAVGRRSGNGLRLGAGANTSNSGAIESVNLFPGDDTAIVGFAFKLASQGTTQYIPSSECPAFLSLRRLGVTQLWFDVDPSGLMRAFRGTTLLGTASLAVVTGSYRFVEIKVVVKTGTAGSIEVRHDNTPVLVLPGINTANGGVNGWTNFRLGPIAAGPGTSGPAMEYQYDDFTVCDGTTAANNDFRGDRRSDLYLPTAQGLYHDSTPSTGTNRALTVDDPAANGDTDYNSLLSVGQKDTFTHAAVTPAGATIDGIQVTLQVRKEDAGIATVRPVVVLGGVPYYGTPQNAPSSYGFLRFLWPVNPATGLPWVDTEVNAAEFGYEKQT